MIIYGGGDCWASTSAIIALSERLNVKKGLNLEAWSRNGNKDPGAGSGHRNAMIQWNGKYYELEAGYSMAKDAEGFRPYDVTERKTLFSCRYTTAGILIYQYDGKDTTGELVIPEQIDGKPVVGIAESTFTNCGFSKITLPDSLTAIESFAFSGCENLRELTIPASVTVIGDAVFSRCYNLSHLFVDAGNPAYKAVDGVLYSKDGSVLVNCPCAENVAIPSGVTKIADYAFYYNRNLAGIVISETVAELGEGAFANCTALADVVLSGKGLLRIGTHCFRGDTALSVMRLPASVKELGAYAYGGCSALKFLYFYGDAPEFGETVENTFYDYVFYGCTLNAFYPEENSSWDETARTGHNGTVTWKAWTGQELVSLKDADVSLSGDAFTYTGSDITPEVTVTMNGEVLSKGEDYTVDYRNNRSAGTALVSVRGIGIYTGTAAASFIIGKASRTVSFSLDSYEIMENAQANVQWVSISGDCTYSSSDTSVAVIDGDGAITGAGAGTAVITVTAAETENYLPAAAQETITVTHDTNVEVLDGNVVDGRIKVKCPRCNRTIEAAVPVGMRVYWYEKDAYGGSSYINKNQPIGAVYECVCYADSDVDMGEFEIISQNETVVKITDGRYVNFIAEGTADVIVRPKYNPAIARTYSFVVGDGQKQENPSNGNTEKLSVGDTFFAGNMKYKITSGSEAVLMKNESKKTTVVIPGKAKGYKVTRIGKNAFKNNRNIQKVTVGSNITAMEANAFSGCKKLKTIVISSKKLKSIGKNAIKGIKSNAVIRVPKSKYAAYKAKLKAKTGFKKTMKIKNK